MSSLRSEGWNVRPSFVPNGPTSLVTLLLDGTGLTQLAGEPAVAWQTPWSELSGIQLTRVARGMALFATTGGVRYCWRKATRSDYAELGALVELHGGQVVRRRRRLGVLAVALIVVLATLAGGIGAWFARGSSGARELKDARAVNLTARDLSSDFAVTTVSPLEYLFTPSTQVVTSTPTTAPSDNATWRKITTKFQSCLGVSNAKDRVYGAAGQMPDYQVSSKIYGTTSKNGIELASTTQYYATTIMVHHDVAEMSKARFGTCFVTSQGALLSAAYGTNVASASSVSAWKPITYIHGWSSGGVETLTLPGVGGTLHLVMVVLASGHYEVTLGAIVAEWPKDKLFLAGLVNTLLARMTSTTAAAV